MIVNYTEAGWQIITQRSHGLLAAQLCAQWQTKRRPMRWMETLIATAEHDDVFNEFDNSDLLDANGAPLNFKDTRFEAEMAQRLIDMAATKSTYIALLISKHIQFVYGSDPKATTFIKKLHRLEKKWLNIAGTTATEVSKSYDLLEFCDAFSLLLCQGMIQPESRRIEISTGPDQRHYEMYLKDEKLIVTPWPFETNSFKVGYETRVLKQLSFKNTSEFKSMIKKAEVTTHWITLGNASESTSIVPKDK